MKQFIKQHPWRLEIVPLVVFATAVILPLVHRHELMASAGSLPLLWPAQNAVQNWWLHHALRLCLLMSPWLVIAQANHEWAQMERRKKINYRVPPYTAFIALAGWFCSQWNFGSLWIALMVISPILQYMIEVTRPFVPRPDEEPLKQASLEGIKPGEQFYYSENRGFGSSLWLIFVFGCCAALGVASFSEWNGGLRMTPTLIVVMIIATSTRVAFVVTNDYISAGDGTRLPILRKLGRSARIRLEDIASCEVYDYQPLEKWYLRSWRTYDGMVPIGPKDGPCLRIVTREGKRYLLGMNRSEDVCRVVGKIIIAAITVRTQQEERQ
jgi:hypothetical protein